MDTIPMFDHDRVIEIHYSGKWHELKMGTYIEIKGTDTDSGDMVAYRDKFQEDATVLIPAGIVVGWKFLPPEEGKVIELPGKTL